jgi:hypothetical protein
MKSIILTKEHKTKLLEMCKALFPELKNLEVRDSMEDFCLDFEHICVEFNRGSELKIIHWFEFCMTHLQNKLFCELNDFSGHLTADYAEECGEQWNNQLMMRTSFFFHNPTRNEKTHPWHPVDYLYSEFKKLKL